MALPCQSCADESGRQLWPCRAKAVRTYRTVAKAVLRQSCADVSLTVAMAFARRSSADVLDGS